MTTLCVQRSVGISVMVCDHPGQRTRVRINGCMTLYGTRSHRVGTMNRKNGVGSPLCIVHS